MTKKELAERNELSRICMEISGRLNGDPCIEYCEDNDEEPEDLAPRMEMAADKARFGVAFARLSELNKKHFLHRKKRNKKCQ